MKLVRKITEEQLATIERSARQVGPGVFYSTIIVIVSFLPVFLLTGTEGKLFHPLAWTKTFILIIDAFLAITLSPVLISFLLRGKLKPEQANPITRVLERIYTPLLHWCLQWRKTVIGVNVVLLIVAGVLFTHLGSEFMPPLDEGSILFMPVTMPDVSHTEIKRILQLQDKIIAAIPEVANVLGKAGRANTATDNSPISMVETIVLLKPHSQWRPGLTKESLINEINTKLQIPGVVNGFTQPIINRINMLSTGIRTDVGVKIFGRDLDTLAVVAEQVRRALDGMNGVKDLYVEPITGGRYLDIAIKRDEIGKYGLSVDNVNMFIETALGGMNLTTTIEGRERFSVNARFAPDYRNNLEAIRQLPLRSPVGTIALADVADIRFAEGPPMITSENAMLRATVLFNVRDRDLGGTVKAAQQRLDSAFSKLPTGYNIEWSGQWENQIRSQRTLQIIMPIVLFLIFIVLYFTYKSMKEAMLTMITVPFALMGGVYILALYHVNVSVAVAVGFIALFGIAIETAMLMTIYLNEYMEKLVHDNGNSRETITNEDLRKYITDGAIQRLRPKLMTVCVSLFGLVPILWANGIGSDVMLPITLPMIGGLITSTIYVLFVTPVVYEISKERELRKSGKITLVGGHHA